MPDSLNIHKKHRTVHHKQKTTHKQLTVYKQQPLKADTDSVAVAQPVHYSPKYPNGFTDTLRMSMRPEKQIGTYPVMEVSGGREPEHYIVSPVRMPGIVLLLIVSFLLVSFCWRSGRKYFSSIFNNLIDVRRRGNHFDDHTMSETRIMIALILQTILMEGIIFYFAMNIYNPEAMIFSPSLNIVFMVGIAGGYYLLQLLIFRIIGYVFSQSGETHIWIQGFNASQALMGLALAPVAFMMLFVPKYNELMLYVAVALYTVARLAFLIKGFRIFFNKFFQCGYFILYLCAVEIVPLIFAYKGTLLIYQSLAFSLK